MSSTPTPEPPSGASTPATASRFTQHTETLEDALKTQTVGLVHLSEFKKRRAELAEAREREAAEKLTPGASAPASRGASTSREGSAAPAAKKRKKDAKAKGGKGAKLSFAGDAEEAEEAEGGGGGGRESAGEGKDKDAEKEKEQVEEDGGKRSAEGAVEVKKRKFNPKLNAPPPKALTKSTLLREAQEREALRREFLALQDAIKNEDISIPFVFYDGTNVAPPTNEPVVVKKGEAVWLFLERARRMSGRREWLRVSVDDLLLVRGEVIIPHHYEFYYFIANRTVGPHGILFDYPSGVGGAADGAKDATAPAAKEDPTVTKVVDRRWYERNKHIFPASIWTEFDPNVDYKGLVRRDAGGNAFFFG